MTLFSLDEWKTERPDPGSPLHLLSLDPVARQLADDLTRAKRIEILESPRGLEFRAKSYVGRFFLGGLTVTIRPKISGAPLLSLFRYAYGLRNLKLYDPVDFASARWAFQDLLIQQLADEVSELIERGIHRDYESVRSNLASPRGRIDFTRYVRTVARVEATLPCIHYPRIEDTLLNRVLLAGLNFAAPLTTDHELSTRVRRLGKILSTTVVAKPVDRAMLAEASRAMDRRTTSYKPAFTLIELLLGDEGVSLNEQGARVQLKGFLFDMNRFFQELISRFLHEHLAEVEMHDEYRLKGIFKRVPGQLWPSHSEPILRPDFVVRRNGQTLAVLDAKYRDLSQNELPSEMLYQLAIYALTRLSGERESAILYPTIDGAARDRSIFIQEPVLGVQLGEVILRPVNLIQLDKLIRQGREAQSQRVELAKRLAFGSPTQTNLF